MSGPVEVETKVDWEEDDFEEFEDFRKGVEKMTDDTTSVAPKSMFDTDETKKWDDDDIDEHFPALLSKEIDYKSNNEVVPVGLTTSKTIKKSRARQEAELDEREKILAQKEFAIAQRKKALDGLTHALRNPDAKAVKKYKLLEDSSKAVDKMFYDIQCCDEKSAGGAADEQKYAAAAAAEFSSWMDQHTKSSSATVYDLKEREMKIAEREKSIKLQERELESSRTKMRRSRRVSIARMLAPNVSVDELKEKEDSETDKVLGVRQRARRRASIQGAYNKAKGTGASMVEAKILVIEAAINVAKAEEAEENEILGAGNDEQDEAMTPASPKRPKKGSTNLPYVARKGDKVDQALAAAINEAGIDISIKRLAMKGKKKGKKGNKNLYQLGNGKKIMVRVVHEVVVASFSGGPANWIPAIQLLKDEADA